MKGRSFFGLMVSLGILDVSTPAILAQERAPQITLNINQFKQFESGSLSTGERVLQT